MDPKLPAALRREYVDFEPDTQSVQEEDCETVVVHVPGFRKEQLKIQLTTTRTLIISGERLLQDNKWSRFRIECPVSTNCDTNRIIAQFDWGILYIRQPKLITPAAILKQEIEKLKLKLDSEAQKTDNIRDHAADQETASSSMADDESHKQTEEKRLSSKSMDAEDFAAERERERERERIDADSVFKKSQEEVEEKSNGIAKDGERTRKIAMMLPGRLIDLVLLVLLALVIGIYVRNWINKSGN